MRFISQIVDVLMNKVSLSNATAKSCDSRLKTLEINGIIDRFDWRSEMEFNHSTSENLPTDELNRAANLSAADLHPSLLLSAFPCSLIKCGN